jgi:hypothetical protein
MKKIYRNFITKDIADKLLAKRDPSKHKIKKSDLKSVLNDQTDLVKKVLDKLKEDFEFKVKDQSYWLVEIRSDGHEWHKDTGSGGHMMWCEVGVSILLSDRDNFEGGDTWYSKDGNDDNATKSDRETYDLVAHTSDEWHKVDPHTGERCVFLMFI